MPLRLIATLVVTASLGATATTVSATAATRHAATVTVTRGQSTLISVRTGASRTCFAQILYGDGLVQQSGVKHSVGGSVRWRLRIPNNAALGSAHWSVHCGIVWMRTGTLVVRAATSTPDNTPHVMVDKQGFRQRPSKYGLTASTVSYGLLLRNTSTHEDAQNVYLLINFTTASGQLVATATQTVTLIPAGETWALGDSMNLRTAEAVTKLEVTVRVTTHEPTGAHPLPHFSDVTIVPAESDPGWVGEVDGEISNDTALQSLTLAKLSIVIMDSSGAIVGGGTGMVFSPLPSGSRMVFLAQQGFTSIPLSDAATAYVSVDPTYSASGP